MVHVGEQVDHLAYSSSSRTYVLGTSRLADFKLPDDDELHPEWRNEGLFGVAFGGTMLTMARNFPVPQGRAKFCEGHQSSNVVCH